MTFDDFFRTATAGIEPYPCQRAFAEAAELVELVRFPTGIGKTATAILGWCHRRHDERFRTKTPRRLVYCLPMRTLVEQTRDFAVMWLDRLGLLAGTVQYANETRTRIASYKIDLNRHSDGVGVFLLMGGADAADWDEHPDRDMILVGTQDMLLSRALNRGYGMSRYRWPVHFGLLNNDCLWVMDETQLMGVGLTTTAQLQGLRVKLATYGVAHSLWMSATLDTKVIATVDNPEPPSGFSTVALSNADREHARVRQRLDAKKPLEKSNLILTSENEKKKYASGLAAAVQEAHQSGTLTLVVLNRVSRAQDTFTELQKLSKQSQAPPEVALIHARFRPQDRKQQEERLFADTMPASGRIVIATQAIEAGVDVSAATMFTELCLWPSLVQRFGRCNRGGEVPSARVIWIDIKPKDEKDKVSLPYDAEELNRSREVLLNLTDVGPASLEGVTVERPASVFHTLRRKDLLDLWDTTPDLAGNDLDVSRFIRDAEDTDVQFYWREFADAQPPDSFPAPQRPELCAVSVSRAREFLGKLKKKARAALVWNPLDRTWREVAPNEVRAGMTLLLKPEMGGYLDAIGWTGDAGDQPTPYPPPESKTPEEGMNDDHDTKSAQWVALAAHLHTVADVATAMPAVLGEVDPSIPWSALIRAARWHDVGKAHPAFINMLLAGRDDAETRRTTLWAKSDDPCLRRPSYWVDGPDGRESRAGFRHELASALVWLKQHGTEADADLIAFLVAAHHGKVRASIRSLPNEIAPADEERRFARGIWEGDELPTVDLGDDQSVPATKLDLGLMELGEGESGPSWLARILSLREEYGPFRLSYLEMLLRVADWRGSRIGERT